MPYLKPIDKVKPIDFKAAMHKRLPQIAERQSSRAPMGAHVHSLQIRVLIYQEDGDYIAHGLEMDLVGHGATEHDALKSLFELIDCQISFAREKGDDSLLLFPAPPEYFDRWKLAQEAAFKNHVFPERSVTLNYKGVVVSLDERLRRLPRQTFEPAS